MTMKKDAFKTIQDAIFNHLDHCKNCTAETPCDVYSALFREQVTIYDDRTDEAIS